MDIKLYHGTTTWRAEAIEQEGFTTNSDGVVYFTNYRPWAIISARAKAEQDEQPSNASVVTVCYTGKIALLDTTAATTQDFDREPRVIIAKSGILDAISIIGIEPVG